jgi:uncharacterized NAD(P)/FAD-binding protein YdhS
MPPAIRRDSEGPHAGGLRVAIVGGGISGLLMALHLHHYAHRPMQVDIFEGDSGLGYGPAFQCRNPLLLLNGETDHLSALDDDPAGFVEWLGKDERAAPFLTEEMPINRQFVPRFLFSDYIRDTFESACRNSGLCELHVHLGRAVTELQSDCAIGLSNGERRVFNRVVLATGVPPPQKYFEPASGTFCVENPWRFDWVHSVPAGPVFLLGTGQTMVDAAVALHGAGCRSPIFAISRRGVVAPKHLYDAGAWPVDPSRFPHRLADIVRLVRREIEEAQTCGLDWRAVTNAARPLTHAAWRRLTTVEQRRFLRHLGSYWWGYRQRVAPQVGERLESMLADSSLQVYAGRIESLRSTHTGTDIDVRLRGGRVMTIRANTLVNCTGPNFDYRSSPMPLIRQLLSDGLACPHANQMGLAVSGEGALIGRSRIPSTAIYTVGAAARGELFETLAIRDIRRQCRTVARAILSALPSALSYG